jgi:hypothetical protein
VESQIFNGGLLGKLPDISNIKVNEMEIDEQHHQ